MGGSSLPLQVVDFHVKGFVYLRYFIRYTRAPCWNAKLVLSIYSIILVKKYDSLAICALCLLSSFRKKLLRNLLNIERILRCPLQVLDSASGFWGPLHRTHVLSQTAKTTTKNANMPNKNQNIQYKKEYIIEGVSPLCFRNLKKSQIAEKYESLDLDNR